MTEPMFYREDVVVGSSKNGKVRYAVVGRTTESISSDSEDTDDSEKLEAINNLKPGFVMVGWYPDGSTEAVKETDLKVIDHPTIPPNIVRRKNGTQLGTVVETEVTCDTCIVGTKKKLTRLKSNNLHAIKRYIEDDVIAYGPWIGYILETQTKLVIRFSNGARAKCIITDDLIDKVDILYAHPSVESGFVEDSARFFPGQLLSGPLSLFTGSSKFEWLTEQQFQTKNKKALVKVLVEQLDVEGINVAWTQRGFSTDFKNPSLDDLPLKVNNREFVGNESTNQSEELETISPSSDLNKNLIESDTLNNTDKHSLESKVLPVPQTVTILNKPCCEIDFKENKLDTRSKVEIELDLPLNPAEPPPEYLGKDRFKFVYRLCHFSASHLTPGARLLYKLTSEDVDHLRAQAKTKSKKLRNNRKNLKNKSTAVANKKLENKDDISSDDEYESYIPSTSNSKEKIKLEDEIMKSKNVEKIVNDSCDLQNGDSKNIRNLSKEKDQLTNIKEIGLPACNVTSTNKPKIELKDENIENSNNDLLSWETILAKRQNGPNVEYEIGQLVTIEVFATRTNVLVEWQDGTVSNIVPSTELVPSDHVNDHDFCPGDFVVLEQDTLFSKLYGMVKSADGVNKMVKVQWYKIGDSSVDKLEMEEMSVYELCDHPTFTFRISDVVFRILNLDNNSQTPDNEVVGEILRITSNGKLLVLWAGGNKSLVYPHEVLTSSNSFRNSEFDEDTDEEGSSQDDTGSWQSLGEDGEDSSLEDLDLITKEAEAPSPLVVDPDVLLENSFIGKKEDMESQDLEQKDEEQNRDVMESSSDTKDEKINKDISITDNIGVIQLGEVISLEKVSENHTYISEIVATDMTTFIKVLLREMKLLKKSLPSGIYVNTYEDRSDLLSVLFEGPVHTPYEDCLFVFDVFLPPDYPVNPPKVHYVSYSPQLNPNLYKEGTVCLSLLGTWMGKGNEKWTNKSNLLQLFVSIQGLIFNAEPYYNEAGFEGLLGTNDGVKNSRCYNEMVYIRLVQHMTSWLNNPPRDFAEISKKLCSEHVPLFARRVNNLLLQGEPKFSNTSFLQDESNFWDPLIKNQSDHNDNEVKCDEVTHSTSSKDEDMVAMATSSRIDKTHFPLLPLSKGAIVSLRSKMIYLKQAMMKAGIEIK